MLKKALKEPGGITSDGDGCSPPSTPIAAVHSGARNSSKAGRFAGKTILIISGGTRGDVQPAAALGVALAGEGARVRMAADASFRAFIQSLGLEYFPLGGDAREMMALTVKWGGMLPTEFSGMPWLRQQIKEVMDSVWLAATAPSSYSSNDSSCSSNSISNGGSNGSRNGSSNGIPFVPDLILGNQLAYGQVSVAEKLGVPLHVLLTIPWLPTKHMPHPWARAFDRNIVEWAIAGTEALLVPLDGLLAFLAPKTAQRLHSWVVARVTAAANRASTPLLDHLAWSGIADILCGFRRRLGLPLLSHNSTGTALHRYPTTCLFSPLLIPRPNDWPSHVTLSGFLSLPQAVARYSSTPSSTPTGNSSTSSTPSSGSSSSSGGSSGSSGSSPVFSLLGSSPVSSLSAHTPGFSPTTSSTSDLINRLHCDTSSPTSANTNTGSGDSDSNRNSSDNSNSSSSDRSTISSLLHLLQPGKQHGDTAAAAVSPRLFVAAADSPEVHADAVTADPVAAPAATAACDPESSSSSSSDISKNSNGGLSSCSSLRSDNSSNASNSSSGNSGMMPSYVPPADLQAFLAAGPAPIYIGFGSMVVEDAGALIQLVLEAADMLQQSLDQGGQGHANGSGSSNGCSTSSTHKGNSGGDSSSQQTHEFDQHVDQQRVRLLVCTGWAGGLHATAATTAAAAAATAGKLGGAAATEGPKSNSSGGSSGGGGGGNSGSSSSGVNGSTHGPEVFFASEVPHEWLFPRCSALVHHGGVGTTAVGLRCGKPTLVVAAFGDLFLWGDRCHELGVGPAPLTLKDMSASTLAAGLQQLTQDPRHKAAAEAVAAGLAAENGLEAALVSVLRTLQAGGDK